jgi:uncharacterized protein involved in oxidation of intracellular sulfur
MKTGIIIAVNEPETAWNAFRFANFALKKNDEVKVFLMGKGVEAENISTEKFDVKKQMEEFIMMKGEIFACGTCLKIRKQESNELCPISTMNDMYEIVKWSDKLITF